MCWIVSNGIHLFDSTIPRRGNKNSCMASAKIRIGFSQPSGERLARGRGILQSRKNIRATKALFLSSSKRKTPHMGCFSRIESTGPYQLFLRLSNPPPPRASLRGRSSIGFASFTVSFRPPKSFPFNISIAFVASSSEDISIKPKPRERPESLSMIIVAEVTVPAWENASLSSSWVVS